jgi:hypothetical protein
MLKNSSAGFGISLSSSLLSADRLWLVVRKEERYRCYSVALVPPVQTAPGSGVWGPCW